MKTSALDVILAARSLDVLLLSKYVNETTNDIRMKMMDTIIENEAWIICAPDQQAVFYHNVKYPFSHLNIDVNVSKQNIFCWNITKKR